MCHPPQQAGVRHHDLLVNRMRELLGSYPVVGAGISLAQVSCLFQESECLGYLPGYLPGSLLLLKWPILQHASTYHGLCVLGVPYCGSQLKLIGRCEVDIYMHASKHASPRHSTHGGGTNFECIWHQLDCDQACKNWLPHIHTRADAPTACIPCKIDPKILNTPAPAPNRHVFPTDRHQHVCSRVPAPMGPDRPDEDLR